MKHEVLNLFYYICTIKRRRTKFSHPYRNCPTSPFIYYTFMPYQQIQRNRPIATLIKWYIDKKSGKVSEARKEIQRRFDYLDWKDQKRIILAFLNAGKNDRAWAYSKVYRQWDDSYLEPMRRLWEQYHEDKCTWSVTEHFPIDYIKENAPINLTSAL